MRAPLAGSFRPLLAGLISTHDTSESSWEDAAKRAVETATKTLRDLRVAEVNKLDLVIVDGKVTAFRARVSLSFKYEAKD